MEEGESSVTSDIESLATSFENLMGDNLNTSSECCIFKTPAMFFRQNERAYVPVAFSIGPFHHGKPNLIATQKIKLKYLHGLLHRAACPEGQLRELIKAIKEIEGKARDCYEGTIEFSVEEFVKILVLDGCFIIELFRKDANVVERDHNDPIFTMAHLLEFLFRDLILLENQIPWLVLELLFNKTKAPTPTSLELLAIEFCGRMFLSHQPSMKSIWKTEFCNKKPSHILDLLRKFLILYFVEDYPPSTFQRSFGQKRSNKNLGWQLFPSATTLKEYGIKFVKVASNSLLNVKFYNGHLEIPSLIIHESTEAIFRNLIIFEQCTPNYPPLFTSYAILMSNIIGTSKDVEILCENGIVDNWLSFEEASQLFNKLVNYTYASKFYYHDLCVQVNRFCSLPRNRWRHFFMHNYFDMSKFVAGVIGGALVILLTFKRAVCSVIQTMNPK